MFVPANDNKPTEAWTEFHGSETFIWAAKHMPGLLWAIKSRGIMHKADNAEKRELNAGNFIWFIRFSYQWELDKHNVELEVIK